MTVDVIRMMMIDRYFEILVDDDNDESTCIIDWYIVSIFLYTRMNYRWMDGCMNILSAV